MQRFLHVWQLSLLVLFVFVLSLNWIQLWITLPNGYGLVLALFVPFVSLILFVGSGFRLASSLFWGLILWSLVEWLYLYGDQSLSWNCLVTLVTLHMLLSRSSRSTQLFPPVLLLMSWAAVVGFTEISNQYVDGGKSQTLSWADLLDFFYAVSTLVVMAWYGYAHGHRLRARAFSSSLLPLLVLVLVWLANTVQYQEYLYYFSGSVKYNIHPQFTAGCYLLVLMCIAWCLYTENYLERTTLSLSISKILVFIAAVLLLIQMYPFDWGQNWVLHHPTQLISVLGPDHIIFGMGARWPKWAHAVLNLGQNYHLYSYPIPSALSFLLEGGVVGIGLGAWSGLLALREIGNQPMGLARKVFLLFFLVAWFVFFPGLRSPFLFGTCLCLLGMVWRQGKPVHPSLAEEFVDILIGGVSRITVVIGFALVLSFSALAYTKVQNPMRAFPETPKVIYPKILQMNVLAVEDVLFHQHHGIDFARLKWLLEAVVRNGKLDRGASTISMQLAKILFLNYDKTLLRKAQQFLIALYLEYSLSKYEILHEYLSIVDFAHGQIGVSQAARFYFGKSLNLLSPEECELLALSIRDPWEFNPQTQLSATSLKRLYALRANYRKFGESLGKSMRTENLGIAH